MKRLSLFLAIAALIAAPTVVFAAEPFSAVLTPEAEVPPADCGDNACSGEARAVVISDDESSIDFEVSYENLTGPVTGSHIHFGGTDVAGPVMIPFEVDLSTSPFSGTFSEADYEGGGDIPDTWDEALDAIRNGNAYVNVHTDANPGGEIRGQLRAIPDTAVAGDATETLLPTALLVVLLAGAVAFVISLRTFALRRA